MTVRFAHLHLHSEYSLVDSTIRIKALVDACVREGIPASRSPTRRTCSRW